MHPEDVTLVVPCYNVADTLPRVLESVQRLDPAPSRVLCIDDGSDDETKAIIESHSGIDLIEHDRNKGLGATLNTALEHTETPLFAKVDGDIVVDPDWLTAMGRTLEESGADFVHGRFTEQVTTPADRWRSQYPSPNFDTRPQRNNPLNGANVIAYTDALRDVGGWDEQYRRAYDDIDIMLRLMESGYEVYYTPQIDAKHIRTDTWREVLRTAWAYHNDPTRRGKPTSLSDVLRRLPMHAYISTVSVLSDARRRRWSIVWISFLRLFFHVKWDLDCVRERR